MRIIKCEQPLMAQESRCLPQERWGSKRKRVEELNDVDEGKDAYP